MMPVFSPSCFQSCALSAVFCNASSPDDLACTVERVPSRTDCGTRRYAIRKVLRIEERRPDLLHDPLLVQPSHKSLGGAVRRFPQGGNHVASSRTEESP